METDEPGRHPDDIRAEAELKYAVELYFEEFHAAYYPGLTSELLDRIKKRYVNDVLMWSPSAIWQIARWYLSGHPLRGDEND